MDRIRTAKIALLVAALSLGGVLVHAGQKDINNDATGPGFTHQPVVTHLQGQYSTNTTSVYKEVAKQDWYITSITTACRAKAGTITFDMKLDGTSVFTSPVPIITTATNASPYATYPIHVTSGQTITYDLAVGTTLDDATIIVDRRSRCASE